MRFSQACFLTFALLLDAGASAAAPLSTWFTNADRIDTLYLWAENSPGMDRFALDSVTMRRSMADWAVTLDADRDRAVLYGEAVDAGAGLIQVRGRYRRGTTPTLAFATVVWDDDRHYELKTSGMLAWEGGRWRDAGRPFLRQDEVVNPRAPTTVVPIPGAGPMMCAALVLVPLGGTVRRR